MTRVPFIDLHGKVAVVTGGSRGIGRECCLALARQGCKIAVCAKSTEDTPNLPGTIYSVAEECKKLGVDAIGVQVDLRSADDIERAVKTVVQHFGRVDILINNASALWWQEIKDTPAKKFDLIVGINARGSFLMTQACLPHMARNGWGRVICMSPPIMTRGFSGRTAYNVSKFGMTMVALGVAEEYAGRGITGNSLWPATVVESQASKNFEMGSASTWRKATILADAVLQIIGDADLSGNMCIDDTYLRTRGWTDADFVQYRCDPAVEPPRLLAPENEVDFTVRRGDVKRISADQLHSRL